ncbi:MAG: TPR end-of-group domain-containing protein [Planctomycetota bacterium]
MAASEPFPTSALHAQIDRLGWTFLADILEIETARHPGNLEALAELGHVYTRQGEYARGLAIDRRLVTLLPEDPTAHYNLACSLALLGSAAEALDELESAVRLGYDDAEHLTADEDLVSLRGDPRFVALLERLQRDGDAR